MKHFKVCINYGRKCPAYRTGKLFPSHDTGFHKYWGIFECEDGSKFFWFGSTNTIAEEK